MKNKKGFTLIELLAVIVVLAIILTIATTSVIKNINDSKEKAKYIAAKEITSIAEVYLSANNADNCVSVNKLIEEGYLEEDTTNPRTGDNGGFKAGDQICKSSVAAQSGYKSEGNKYTFEGYEYRLASDGETDLVIGDVNQDGKLTQEDAELILRFASGTVTPTETQKELADMNGDGKITAVDARKVLQEIDADGDEIKGDVNQDGKLTQEDAELILKFASGTVTPTETQKELADMNGDGKITAVDARKVLQEIDADGDKIKGDVNQDGKLTQEDAELILKFASGTVTPTETQKELADMNKDGKITAVDARIVLKQL